MRNIITKDRLQRENAVLKDKVEGLLRANEQALSDALRILEVNPESDRSRSLLGWPDVFANIRSLKCVASSETRERFVKELRDQLSKAERTIRQLRNPSVKALPDDYDIGGEYAIKPYEKL